LSTSSTTSVVPDSSTPPLESPHSLRHELRLVGRHSLIYMLGPALSNAVGFVMIPIYTRFVSSSEFGIMSLVDVVMTLTMMILALGVADGMTRFYYAEADDAQRRRLVSTAILGPAVLSLPIIGLAILAADWLRSSLGIGPEYVNYLRLALVIAWFSMLAEVGLSYLRMCYMSRTFVAIVVFQIVVSVILNVWLVVVMGWGIWGILYSTMALQAGIGLVLSAIILGRTRAYPSWAHLRRLLGFGVHLVPSTVALQLSNYLNPLMLRWLLPGDPLTALAQVGLFSVGQKFAVVVNRFLTVPFNAFWRPRRMELVLQDRAVTRHILARMCTYSTVLTCQFALLVSVWAEDVLTLLLEPSYVDGHRVVPWIAAAYVILSLEHHFATGMHYARRTQWATPIGIIALAALVAMNLILVPRYGIVAAAAASLISVTIRSALFLLISQRLHYIPFELGRLMLLAAVAVSLYLVAGQIASQSIVVNVTIRGLMAASLLPILTLFGFFSWSEVTAARGVLQQREA
jgi:O-antigen/teichoic acid export membrane protein